MMSTQQEDVTTAQHMGRCKTHKTGSQWDLNEKPLVEDCVVMAVATHSPELTMLKQQEGKSGRVPSSLCFWGAP